MLVAAAIRPKMCVRPDCDPESRRRWVRQRVWFARHSAVALLMFLADELVDALEADADEFGDVS